MIAAWIGKARRSLLAVLAVSAFHGVVGTPTNVHGQTAVSTSIVRGRVIEHETGTPLPQAVVSLTPTGGGEDEPPAGTPTQSSAQDSIRTFSRSAGGAGQFLFEEVLPGLYRLEVNLLGYLALQDTLAVEAGSELELTLPLSVSPIRLEPIVVISRRRPVGPLVGFETRRLRSGGFFLTREQIEASGAFEFSDLLRRAPGIRMEPNPPYKDRVYFRGGCVPDLWVDGTLAGTTPDIDSFLRPEIVEAVEVYQGAELPIEFGSNLCGAIVVWTRRGRSTTGPSEGGLSLRGQMVLGGSLLLLSILALLLSR